MSSEAFGPTALVTPANAVSMARLLSTPLVLVAIAAWGPSLGAALLFAALALTDGVDGYIARRQGTTRSGTFLDPLADKFLVLGAMAVLVGTGIFSWLPVGLIALREGVISAYRSSWVRKGMSVPASPLAKAKTVSQDAAVGFALLPYVATNWSWLAQSTLWIAVVLSLVSGAQYLIDGHVDKDVTTLAHK